MYLEIVEVIIFGLVLISTGFGVGWAVSAGRMAATKPLKK
jgi:hypothetical protein